MSLYQRRRNLLHVLHGHRLAASEPWLPERSALSRGRRLVAGHHPSAAAAVGGSGPGEDRERRRLQTESCCRHRAQLHIVRARCHGAGVLLTWLPDARREQPVQVTGMLLRSRQLLLQPQERQRSCASSKIAVHTVRQGRLHPGSRRPQRSLQRVCHVAVYW
jgi:hypothetical protein